MLSLIAQNPCFAEELLFVQSEVLISGAGPHQQGQLSALAGSGTQ